MLFKFVAPLPASPGFAMRATGARPRHLPRRAVALRRWKLLANGPRSSRSAGCRRPRRGRATGSPGRGGSPRLAVPPCSEGAHRETQIAQEAVRELGVRRHALVVDAADLRTHARLPALRDGGDGRDDGAEVFCEGLRTRYSSMNSWVLNICSDGYHPKLPETAVWRERGGPSAHRAHRARRRQHVSSRITRRFGRRRGMTRTAFNLADRRATSCPIVRRAPHG